LKRAQVPVKCAHAVDRIDSNRIKPAFNQGPARATATLPAFNFKRPTILP